MSIEDNKPAPGSPALPLSADASPTQTPSEEPEEIEIIIPEPAAQFVPPPLPQRQIGQIEALKAQLAQAEEKVNELGAKLKESHERMLRAAADLENFRKRTLKEKEEIQRFGADKLLKDFLPIQDNLERALEHATSSGDFDSLRQGVGMTRKLFEDMLARYGMRTFQSVGRPFDPRLHEALQQVETAELAPNHVISEVIKGYVLNDRLARPALVIVSKPPPSTEPNPGAEPAKGPDSSSAPEAETS